MKKFFLALLVVTALSSVASARTTPVDSAHEKVVKRGVVETAPKRKTSVIRHSPAMAPKPLFKKSAKKKFAAHKKFQRKTVAAAKKKSGQSFFWKMVRIVSKPAVLLFWLPLTIVAIAIIVQIHRRLPKREKPVEIQHVAEEALEENPSSWDQKLWTWIKDQLRRFKEKPAIASC